MPPRVALTVLDDPLTPAGTHRSLCPSLLELPAQAQFLECGPRVSLTVGMPKWSARLCSQGPAHGLPHHRLLQTFAR